MQLITQDPALGDRGLSGRTLAFESAAKAGSIKYMLNVIELPVMNGLISEYTGFERI